jgi:hypothetical protein
MRTVLFALNTLLLCILATPSTIMGQSLSYGFKAGLNTSAFDGPLENERKQNQVGFHIGVIFKYELTDLFGLRGEFMYSQKGSEYFYDGPSFFYLEEEGNSDLVRGTRNLNLSISNDYLDFPIMVYGKFGRIELNGGFNVGLLVGSSGTGQLRFTGDDPPVDEFSFNLDYRYYRDEPGEGDRFEEESIRVGPDNYLLPKQLGAYYEYDEKDGSRFNFIDVGLVAGISFYLNEGLYLGARGNWGLVDVTNGDMEPDYSSFQGNVPARRNDTDKQISYQFSLGFSF